MRNKHSRVVIHVYSSGTNIARPGQCLKYSKDTGVCIDHIVGTNYFYVKTLGDASRRWDDTQHRAGQPTRLCFPQPQPLAPTLHNTSTAAAATQQARPGSKEHALFPAANDSYRVTFSTGKGIFQLHKYTPIKSPDRELTSVLRAYMLRST